MAATKSIIREWFTKGAHAGFDRLVVVVDTYDCEDYPVFLMDSIFWDEYPRYDNFNMQRVMEVYDLKQSLQSQFDEHRAFHFPERPVAQ